MAVADTEPWLLSPVHRLIFQQHEEPNPNFTLLSYPGRESGF